MATIIGNNLPPLPPGFVIGDLSTGQVIPALPEGFIIEGQQPVPEMAPEPSQPSFGERVTEDLGARGQQLRQIAVRTAAGEQLIPRSVLQATGVVVGGGLDILGEAVSEITPDSVKNFLRNVGSEIADTEAGQFVSEQISSGAQKLGELEQTNPALAQDIKSIGNLALFGAGSLLPTGISKTPIGKVGEKITEAGKRQTFKKKGDFIKNLIKPKQTAAVRAEQVGRTVEKGLLRRKEIIPTAREGAIALEVSKIPAVNPKRSLQFNFNAIQDRVGKQSGGLQTSLEKLKTTFDSTELQGELARAATRLSENPFTTKATTDKLMSKFNEIINKSPNTPAGLLSARKEFDGFVKSIKPKVFDAQSENAFSTAVKEIRNTTHNFLDKNVKDIAVKKSLNRQHNLLTAMDNIKTKAADEANSSISRLAQNISKAVPLKAEIAGVAALGGLSLAGIINPFSIVPAAALFGAGKFVMSPAAKRSLGFLVKSADDAITKTTNAALKKELKLDKAIILEMIEESDLGEEQEIAQPVEQAAQQPEPIVVAENQIPQGLAERRAQAIAKRRGEQ